MTDSGLGITENSLRTDQLQKSPLVQNMDVDADPDPLQKLSDIELLPDLFALIQSLEKGDIQPKDFDNNAGNIRLKAKNVRLYLQEVDGICETVDERESKIGTIRQSNMKKVEFLTQFRERVLRDLEKDNGST